MMPKAKENRVLTTTVSALALVVVLLVVGFLVPITVQSATYTTLPELSAQDESPVSAIKTDDGYLLVWNQPDLHFTVLLKGKNVQPLGDTEHVFLNVDGMVVQVQLASIKQFAPDAKARRLDEKGILTAHRDWESKYLEGLLSSKLKLQSYNAKLSTGGDASLWQFDMPEGMNAEARKQLYLTTVRGDYVVLLNATATTSIPEETARKFLLDTMATLKISPTPIDVKKLSESIRKGVGP
jgi:hypothetical protein